MPLLAPDSRTPRPQPPTGPPSMQVNWRTLLWYLPMMLLMLWMWQDLFYQLRVRTIPYSEFKSHVASHEVIECDVKDDEIVGMIRLTATPAAQSPAVKTSAESSQPPMSAVTSTAEKAASEASNSVSAAAKKSETPSAAATEKPADSTQKTTAKKTAKKEEFIFRTVRVEDPKLVEDLEAGGVKFVGIRPSFLSNLLMSWILPIGAMFLLWTFLSRRLGAAGQAVLSIGKSRAKLAGEKETGVTFADVAGCDEAKYELEEVVDFLKHPSRYTALGAKIPRGVLLVGPPGTGKH